MSDNGIIVVGGQTTGYTERSIYVYWDISPDLSSERQCGIVTPYYVVSSTRYIAHQHIQYAYCNRWVAMEYTKIPVSDRKIFVHYAKCMHSERTMCYNPDTCERMIYVEALLTTTPLLIKYPKYFNWNYVPQIINPEFMIWSHYDLDIDNITLKITSTNGVLISLNSGANPDKFSIKKFSNNQYKLIFYVDHVFDPGDTVTCYVMAYDIKGNYLKPGMW